MTAIVEKQEAKPEKDEDNLLGLFDPSAKIAPQREKANEASMEFAGNATMIAGKLHNPITSDDRLIHADIDRGLELDVTITESIPYTMAADFFYLIKTSRAAERELDVLNTRAINNMEETTEEVAIEALFYEVPEQEITDQVEWDDYWRGIVEEYRAFRFEQAVIESKILTQDDIEAWRVMVPFCYSLPDKYALTTMAKEGKRAEHGVQNIGSILHRETMNQDSGTLDKLREKLHLNRR